MMEADQGDTAPRYHIVRTDYRHYELWIANRVAVFDSRAELDRCVELLTDDNTQPPAHRGAA